MLLLVNLFYYSHNNVQDNVQDMIPEMTYS